MNRVEAALRRIVADLDARVVPYALVGGFAVSARTEPRFTRDVDVAVAVADDAAAELLIRSLTSVGYALTTLVEHEHVGTLATARLLSPGSTAGAVVVDLLFASAGVEAEIAAGAEVLQILPGLRVPVAAAGHLVALKLLARDDRTRPQDAADLQALGTVLTHEDREAARAAVTLIEQRGFARGRPLSVLLEAYLSEIARTS